MKQQRIYQPDQILTDSFRTLPRNYYQVIVADPPWSYESKTSGGSGISGAAAKYPTMTMEEIASLPVNQIAAENAILFLWITTPLKADIFENNIITKWNFRYKTTVYWRKIMSLGMGYYFRGQVEECLVCVKGDIPAFHQQVPNIFQCKAGKHSEKPLEFWETYVFPVVQNFGYDRLVELFSRAPQPGWDAFGNQIKQEEES